MKKTALITVQNVPVTVMHIDQSDYISLTDMAKARTDAARAADVIKNWLRARSTLEFLGTWEVMYNPAYIPLRSVRKNGLNAPGNCTVSVECTYRSGAD